MFCSHYDMLEKSLVKRGFIVHQAKDANEAKQLAFSLIKPNESVGFGGSVTVQNDLDLYNELEKRGNPVYSHWYAADRSKAQGEAGKADWYLASTNAILGDGRLINIDGTGNRVASMIIGPEKVMLFIGRNKFVDGGIDDAIERIKRETCPPNARRLKLDKLPCGITGKCADCQSEQRMCRVTSIIEYPTRAIKEFHLVLIDAEHGR